MRAPVVLAFAGDSGDAFEIPILVVEPFEFAGEIHASRFGSRDILDQGLKIGLFVSARDDFGFYLSRW